MLSESITPSDRLLDDLPAFLAVSGHQSQDDASSKVVKLQQVAIIELSQPEGGQSIPQICAFEEYWHSESAAPVSPPSRPPPRARLQGKGNSKGTQKQQMSEASVSGFSSSAKSPTAGKAKTRAAALEPPPPDGPNPVPPRGKGGKSGKRRKGGRKGSGK